MWRLVASGLIGFAAGKLLSSPENIEGMKKNMKRYSDAVVNTAEKLFESGKTSEKKRRAILFRKFR